MLLQPMDVLHQFPVRKSKAQKQAFRDAVQTYAQGMGYETSVERKCLSCQNLILGDPETATILVTAHYDTCAKMLKDIALMKQHNINAVRNLSTTLRSPLLTT